MRRHVVTAWVCWSHSVSIRLVAGYTSTSEWHLRSYVRCVTFAAPRFGGSQLSTLLALGVWPRTTLNSQLGAIVPEIGTILRPVALCDGRTHFCSCLLLNKTVRRKCESDRSQECTGGCKGISWKCQSYFMAFCRKVRLCRIILLVKISPNFYYVLFF
jgi:hypothetical protein